MALTLTNVSGVIQPPFNVPARAGTGSPAQRIRQYYALYQIFASLPLIDRYAIAALVMANYCQVQGGTNYTANISGLINDSQIVMDQGGIYDDTVGTPTQIWSSAKTLDGTVSTDIPTLLNSARALKALPLNQLQRIVNYLRLNCGY